MEQTPNTEQQKEPAAVGNTEELIALIKQVNLQMNKPKSAARPDNAMEAIDLLDLFWYVMARLKYVVVVAVLGALLGGLYGQSTIRASYTATSKLYLPGSTLSVSELQLSTLLSGDYQEIFNTWEIHEMVRSELDLPYSYSQLQGMVSVSNPTGTRLLYITARNSDAQMAAKLANAYANAAKDFILKTMDGREPSIFSAALVPSISNAGSEIKYIAMGFMAGAAIPVAIITLLFMMDDRPGSAEDIEKATGMNVLAVLPASRIRQKKSNKRRAKK